MIVTRFAPSPTGFLHIGHAYAALTARQAARDNGGKFLLRIEDIDLARCRPEFEQAICEDLTWLGIGWDTGVRRQSQHSEDYTAAIERLETEGLVYPCFCTRNEIAAEIARATAAPHADELVAARYPGICRSLSRAERAARIANGNAYALRLDCTKALASIGTQKLAFEEMGSGPEGEEGHLRADPERIGDIVLARKELPTSYHLAVVVDDALQGVTLVTRGQDLFAATHIQRLLQVLLSLPAPQYLHHRLILNQEGKKFSKRDGAVTLRALRNSGVSPEEIRRMIGM
ncbi:MAG TPA: tRNA glutamyl-Q(34) synthetase GluQRS [Micropepsaceae bacterium]|nr:tRNA glutamyl-Q(34) synthetase GluQRS [Micropepsaceae bacterium]